MSVSLPFLKLFSKILDNVKNYQVFYGVQDTLSKR